MTLASPSLRCPRGTCPTAIGNPSLAITAGAGSQLVLTYLPSDGGQSCVLTGTVQSSTTFSLDLQTSQGCQFVLDGGASRTDVVQSGSGTVDAETKRPEGQPDWTLRPQVAEPPPAGSMEHVLDQLDLACYAVAPADLEALRSKVPVRNVGAVVYAGLGQFSHACVPADVYDLLVYFREVRPSRLL